jgi:hypothetical protein
MELALIFAPVALIVSYHPIQIHEDGPPSSAPVVAWRQRDLRRVRTRMIETKIHWPFNKIFCAAPLPQSTVDSVLSKLQEAGITARH